MITLSQFPDLLAEVQAFWQPLPDKPEETPEAILRALWCKASGAPASTVKALALPLYDLEESASVILRDLLEKKKSGIPLSHLTERQNFLGLELIAGPGALIPRRETEIVGRAALAKLKLLLQKRSQALVVDVCTGSGNLALAYAYHEPKSRVYGADLSQDAVDLANRNREFTGLSSRTEFRQGDLLAPFESDAFLGQVDLLSCNPPYISTAKVSTMAREISAFEPQLAFNGGAFGISILTRFLKNAPRFMKSGSYMCFEVGLGQGKALAAQLGKNPVFTEVETWADEAGEIRALSARSV